MIFLLKVGRNSFQLELVGKKLQAFPPSTNCREAVQKSPAKNMQSLSGSFRLA
jgi:hypothetical protein